jgi:hypothetical protein
VKLLAGSLPSPYIDLVLKGNHAQALRQAISRHYIYALEKCQGDDKHFDISESYHSGREPNVDILGGIPFENSGGKEPD